MTPFEALYGYSPPQVDFGQFLWSHNPEVNDLVQEKQRTTKLLKENLENAQQRMKMFADKKRSERVFEVGDYIYLKLQPYRQTSVEIRQNMKLAPRFYRPYLIEKKIGQVTYQLKLPPQYMIHPVFHVSLLKKKIGSKYTSSTELPQVDKQGDIRTYPLSVLERRIYRKGNVMGVDLLVNWVNLPEDYTTWEDFDSHMARFSDFDLCGQGSTQ